MKETKFEIFYFGLSRGVSEQKAIESLEKLLNIETEAAQKIIANVNQALSSGLTDAKAKQYYKAFKAAGLEVEIRACTIEKEGFSSTPPPKSDDAEMSVMDRKDETLDVEFHGKGFEYFKIWIVNIFLTIVTLGIYSAWAKVRNKQYFYGNTLIEGSSFQYTAKPIAILKGRLIAVAFFALYSIVNQFNPLIGLALFIVLMIFLPWIIVRSLQFNARNSVYRNIRFNFTANKKQATSVFLLWPILIPFTFGLILPFIWYKQAKFFISHSAYGTQNFEYSASAKDYYKIFLNLFLVLIGFSILMGIAVASLGVSNAEMMPSLAPLMGPIILLFYLFMFAYSSAALGNLLFNATTLRAHGFSSSLQIKNMAWLYFSNTLGIILTVGLFIPWAQVRIARYRANCLKLEMTGSLVHFVNAETKQVAAFGEQMGEVFDMDVSIL